MGKYKFRFSDMVPHAWFYKLRDIGQNRRKTHNYSPRESLARKSFTSASSPKLSFVSNRGSYYYSTAVVEARKNLNSPVLKLAKRQDVDLPLNTPRKMKRRIHRRHCKVLINNPSPKRVTTTASFRCNFSNGSDKCEKDMTENYETCLFYSEKASRITDFNSETDRKCSISTKLDNTKNSSGMIEIGLSPIRTRSDEVFKENDNSFNEDKKPHLKVKQASQRAQRIHTRVVTSPKIGTRNAAKEKKLKKDLKESLAVRKFSSDPQRDFTESMIEMIIANNMRSSSDLEDLLACYLCLNSDDYHSVIIKAFKQVWLDLSRLRIIE